MGYETYSYYCTSQEMVVVGYLPSSHDSALFVAKSKEMFEREGINVQMVPFRAGQDIIRAAETNQIDIGYCGITPATIAIDKGIPIKIVAAVNEEGSGIVVGKNTNINNITDLKGKNIAIPRYGSVQDLLLKDVLNGNNISFNEVNINELDVPLMPEKLHEGGIDAFVAWEPYLSSAQLDDDGHVLLNSHGIWNDHPCCVIIARDKFIQDNPKLLEKFLKIHVQATDYVNTHKDETAVIVSKKLFTDVDVESIKYVEFVARPTDNFKANVLKIVNLEKHFGYIKKNLTLEKIFDLSHLPSK